MDTQTHKPARRLGALGVFSIAAGGMISSGLFVLPGIVFATAGPAIVLAYALASLLIVPVMLAKAELATAMPRAGGSYFFVERSLGPLVGTVAGIANWLSIIFKSAFALIGIGGLADYLFPGLGGWGVQLVALLACGLFTGLNLVGVEKAGRVQSLLVLILLAILAGYVSLGMGVVDGARFSGVLEIPTGAVLAAAGMIVISFGGLTKVASVAHEVDNPARTLTRGLFAAFGLVSLLYVLTVFVTVGVVEGEALSGSLVPLILGAERALGPRLALVLEVGAFLAFATTANAGIMAASRVPFAMSRDGLLPAILARTSRRFGTPNVAICLTGLMIALLITGLSIEDLVKSASTMLLLSFMLVCLSQIVFRFGGLKNYRPSYRAPLSPWIQIPAVFLYAYLAIHLGEVPLLVTGAFVLLAVIWYFLYVGRSVHRDSAFIHLMRRVLDEDPTVRPGLEGELKQIAIERDRIEPDRFDALVEEATILDIPGPISAKALFRRLAEELAPKLKIDAQEVYQRFLKRERLASTIVRPGLAIPHLTLERTELFALLLVRCREGIVYSWRLPPVTQVFVIVNSPDERNFHLRALMQIALIAYEDEFAERWAQAANVEEIRDLIHLSSRPREARPEP